LYQIGTEITIEPTELVASGAAIAKIDGFPIFVAGVYPGDVALVRLTEVKKGFARGELVRLVTPGPLRRLLPCPIAGECGGCDWTSLRLDAQLAAKERILRESLRRIGKLDPAALPPITVHPSSLNYRLRSRLHTDGRAVGFYAVGSHRVVPLAKECEVVGVRTAEQLGIDLTGKAPGGDAAGDDRGRQIWELDGQLIDDDRELTITAGRYTFRLSTGAFFQVNRHLLGELLRLVHAHAERTRGRGLAVDLYSGVGFFSAPLAETFGHVIGVEGSAVAHRYAQVNAAANVEPVQAPVEQWVTRMPEADFVFLDPPRSGAARNVIEAVAAKAREVICFLACDPVTFARDAKGLTASGWRLVSLDLLDLFPNTHHVETLARFERASETSG
jgi:tRNA/tmRNA/rRNA uracil-C5-methylase (TrmA/RlmC/RlmD family)